MNTTTTAFTMPLFGTIKKDDIRKGQALRVTLSEERHAATVREAQEHFKLDAQIDPKDVEMYVIPSRDYKPSQDPTKAKWMPDIIKAMAVMGGMGDPNLHLLHGPFFFVKRVEKAKNPKGSGIPQQFQLLIPPRAARNDVFFNEAGVNEQYTPAPEFKANGWYGKSYETLRSTKETLQIMGGLSKIAGILLVDAVKSPFKKS